MTNNYSRQRYLFLKAVNESPTPLTPREVETAATVVSTKEFGTASAAQGPLDFGSLLRSSFEFGELTPQHGAVYITDDGQATLHALDMVIHRNGGIKTPTP